MQPVTCSVDDAAKAIGIGKVTLYKHLRSGAIKTVKRDGRRLANIASLLRWAGESE